MKSISDELRDHLQQEVTTICSCLSIRRRDGRSYFFTDHDRAIWVDEQKYSPQNSFARTAISTTVELEVDGLDIHGILNSTAILRDDINGGLFDFAEIEMFAVNYEAPEQGRLRLRRGWLGEIEMMEDGTFTAEVRGLTQVLTYRLGEVYSPECRADLGDNRCKIPINPPRWSALQNYRVGDYVIGVVDAAVNYYPVALTNPSFESDDLDVVTRTVDAWTTYGADNSRWMVVDDTEPLDLELRAAKDGTQFVIQTGVLPSDPDTAAPGPMEIGMYQDYDLDDHGVDLDAIDTGLCRLSFSIWASSLTGGATARFRVICYDADGAALGTVYDSGDKKYADDRWVQSSVNDTLIPTGTRELRFDLYARKKSDELYGMAFDNVEAVINLPDGTFGSYTQFGGRMFLCTTAGVSGDTEPSWTGDVDETYTDGSVEWLAKDTFVDVVTVTSPIDRKNFGSTSGIGGKPDGWYDGGLLTWETGLNAGRSMEIKYFDSTSAGATFHLFQRTFYAINAGDRFLVRPGCDKRIATCGGKFDNAINFRGEPFVPGQDEYYRTPNAHTTEEE